LAAIQQNTGRVIYQTQKWLGLNESGAAGIKSGELSQMLNWKITDKGHLRVRGGIQDAMTFAGNGIRGMWSGFAGGTRATLVAAGGAVWKCDFQTGAKTAVGSLTDAETNFFGFGGNVYVQNGTQYKVWTGSGNFTDVTPYVPVVAVSAPPAGGGTLLERANLLTGQKRQRFSPDGTAYLFQLAETNLTAVEWVKVNGASVSSLNYGVNLENGTVQFNTAARPAKGVNTVEIQWRRGLGDPGRILSMKYAELYNGLTDARVFLYGDGSNTLIYSGLNEFGEPDASYFPALNEAAIDSKNNPVTGVAKHYDQLSVFKDNGAWAITYGSLTLTDGSVTAGFCIVPIHGEVGNTAPGQVRLLNNTPATLFGKSMYLWSVNGVRDERSASMASSRIAASLAQWDLKTCVTYDDSYNQEYYIFHGTEAIVYNYSRGVFYKYALGVNVRCALLIDGVTYLGCADGSIKSFCEANLTDNGSPVIAELKCGSADYDRRWLRKFAANVYLTLHTDGDASLSLCNSSDSGAGEWRALNISGDGIVRVKTRLRKFGFGQLCVKCLSGVPEIISISVEVGYGGKIT
jgi:hypothetical protein